MWPGAGRRHSARPGVTIAEVHRDYGRLIDALSMCVSPAMAR